MGATYSKLAARAAAAVAALPPDAPSSQWWCAVAGGPGAGKSTLAEAVAARCAADFGVDAVVLPMDGFHYSRAALRALDPPDAASFLPRRGAPHTFDAEGFEAALRAARASRAAVLPTYSRVASDPVPGGAELAPRHRAVFVEGNYVLLGALLRGGGGAGGGTGGEAAAAAALAAYAPDAGAPRPVADEAARWAGVLDLFDERWFVAPAGGVAEQRGRLIARHLETWTDAKTAQWGAATAEEGAARRTDANDVINARLIECCRPFADLVIDSV